MVTPPVMSAAVQESTNPEGAFRSGSLCDQRNIAQKDTCPYQRVPRNRPGHGARQIVVASLLVGAIIGVASGGQIMDRPGLRRALFLASLIFTLGALVTLYQMRIAIGIFASCLVGYGLSGSGN